MCLKEEMMGLLFLKYHKTANIKVLKFKSFTPLMFTISFYIFPCLTPRCMESFVDPVPLIQAGLNISIRIRGLTLKEVRLCFYI